MKLAGRRDTSNSNTTIKNINAKIYAPLIGWHGNPIGFHDFLQSY